MAFKKASREPQLSVTQYVPAAVASQPNLVNSAAPFLYKTASIRTLPPMILQKTGWRIKQLISHRPSRTFDDGEIPTAEKERRVAGKPLRRPSKRRSWIGSAKSSIDVSFLERSRHGCQFKQVTARSSSNSLCSSINDDSPHSLFSEPNSPKILYLQPTADLSGDAQAWRLIFPGETTSQPRSKSTFDLLEALALEPTDEEKTPTPTIKNTRSSLEILTNPDICEGVEQLIRETDEAFKGINTAFAPQASKSIQVKDEGTKEESMQSGSDVERHVLKKQKKVPVSRSNSVSKAKVTKSTKKKARLLDLAASGSASPPIVNSPSQPQRWTLVDVTDNISDIFSRRRMFRMEVNEMIDTTRIGRIPQAQKNHERKGSVDTNSSHGTDELPGTPNDPFALDSLSSRLGASGIVPTPPDPTNGPGIPLKSALRSPKRDSAIYIGNSPSVTSHPGSLDISMPSGPSPRQRSCSYPRQPSLPTIEEVSPMTPNRQPSLRKPNSAAAIQVSPSLDVPLTPRSGEHSGHILLNSTPFTLTSPHFQHGSIRLPQGQKRRFKATNSPVSETTPGSTSNNKTTNKSQDTALDWTAFQMAISGGTGNYLMGGTDPEAEIEGTIEEIEEIVEWWKEFGFEGAGRMVDGNKAAAAHRKKKSKLMNSADKGISYELDGTSFSVPTNTGGAKKTGREMMGKEHPEVGSLPPSPMEDLAGLKDIDVEGLRLRRAGTGRLESLPDSVVPMGFNLSHDLDDYLRWSETARGVEEE